jgi:hypothetical protein
MVNRLGGVFVLACATFAVPARPVLAQQTLNLSLGHFTLSSEGRVETDILLIEHADLVFDVNDFDGVAIGGELLVPIGNLFEAGVGVSYSQRTVPTVDERWVNSDGSRIPRDLGYRQFPVTLTVRVLPLGQSYSVQPYIGGGVALIVWGFSESGDWADRQPSDVRPPDLPRNEPTTLAPDQSVFRGERYLATGIATGTTALLGLRVTRDAIALGVEGRYQRALGSFGPSFARVLDPDINLDGWTLQFTTGLRFGE